MKYLVYLFFGLSLLEFSCKPKTESVIPPIQDSSVFLTEDQLRMAEVETGKLKRQILSREIECSGITEISPGNRVSVSFPFPAFVSDCDFFPGEYVKKGEVLAVLEHPDIINLQKEYLTQKAELDYYREEFKRQGELAVEQASSLKKMQFAESEYKSREINVKSAEARLKMMGIDPSAISAEHILPKINLISPISGYLSRAEVHKGMYLDALNGVFEVVDKSHIHLVLGVYEKDIFQVRKGQKVLFQTVNPIGNSMEAYVETTGQVVKGESRTIEVHAHIPQPDPSLIHGMYVHAKIQLDKDSVYVVPATAIGKDDEGYYLFLQKQGRFYRRLVQIGNEKDNWVEIVHPSEELLNSVIVTKGAYYIASEEGKEE